MTEPLSRGGPQRIPRPPGTRPGRPAAWASLDPESRRLTLDLIRQRLSEGAPPRPSPVERLGVKASAVLVPLYDHEGEPYVILTRRAWHLRSHTGEVSFPGGRHEPGDPDLVATALRESREEIGLDPSIVDVIGELDHLTTVTSVSYIAPFVGILSERPALRPDANEVDAVLHVSLEELLLDEVFREERWGLLALDRPIMFFELVGDTVWGATAAMLHGFLLRVLGIDQAP